jgi:hypothetical protein
MLLALASVVFLGLSPLGLMTIFYSLRIDTTLQQKRHQPLLGNVQRANGLAGQMFSARSALMAAYATMDTTMSGVFYAVRAEGL